MSRYLEILENGVYNVDSVVRAEDYNPTLPKGDYAQINNFIEVKPKLGQKIKSYEIKDSDNTLTVTEIAHEDLELSEIKNLVSSINNNFVFTNIHPIVSNIKLLEIMIENRESLSDSESAKYSTYIKKAKENMNKFLVLFTTKKNNIKNAKTHDAVRENNLEEIKTLDQYKDLFKAIDELKYF